MTLMKKLVLGWLGLCVVTALWTVATGNTSKEEVLKNELTGICEDAFEDNEGLVSNKLFEFSMQPIFESIKSQQPLMLKVEYDNDIAPIVEAKRGVDRRELNISCQQKLVSNYKGIEPWAIIMVHRNKNGNFSYEVTEVDIYEVTEKLWWSDI